MCPYVKTAIFLTNLCHLSYKNIRMSKYLVWKSFFVFLNILCILLYVNWFIGKQGIIQFLSVEILSMGIKQKYLKWAKIMVHIQCFWPTLLHSTSYPLANIPLGLKNSNSSCSCHHHDISGGSKRLQDNGVTIQSHCKECAVQSPGREWEEWYIRRHVPLLSHARRDHHQAGQRGGQLLHHWPGNHHVWGNAMVLTE